MFKFNFDTAQDERQSSQGAAEPVSDSIYDAPVEEVPIEQVGAGVEGGWDVAVDGEEAGGWVDPAMVLCANPISPPTPGHAGIHTTPLPSADHRPSGIAAQGMRAAPRCTEPVASASRRTSVHGVRDP